MKNSEIREFTDKELVERIDTEKAMLLKMRINHTVTPLDNPHKMTALKRDIARLKTEVGHRERTGQKGAAVPQVSEAKKEKAKK